MAYNTKSIVTDVESNPIAQYYNPESDSYEPVEGSHGANKVILYNADGSENTGLSLLPILDKLSQLTGTVIDEETRKSNEIIRQDNEQLRVQLYNDLMAQLDRIEQIQEQVPETVVDSINDIRDKLGDLTLLDTAEKSNLVLALNEIYNDLVAHKAENATQAHPIENVGGKFSVSTNLPRFHIVGIRSNQNLTSDTFYTIVEIPTSIDYTFTIQLRIGFADRTQTNILATCRVRTSNLLQVIAGNENLIRVISEDDMYKIQIKSLSNGYGTFYTGMIFGQKDD